MKQKRVIIVDGRTGAAQAAYTYMRKHGYETLMLGFEGPIAMAIQSLFALPHSVAYYVKEEDLDLNCADKLFYGNSYYDVRDMILASQSNEFLGLIASRTINTNKFNDAFVFSSCTDVDHAIPVVESVGIENVCVISCEGGIGIASQLNKLIPAAKTTTLPTVDSSLLHTLICGTINTHFNLEDPA